MAGGLKELAPDGADVRDEATFQMDRPDDVMFARWAAESATADGQGHTVLGDDDIQFVDEGEGDLCKLQEPTPAEPPTRRMPGGQIAAAISRSIDPQGTGPGARPDPVDRAAASPGPWDADSRPFPANGVVADLPTVGASPSRSSAPIGPLQVLTQPAVTPAVPGAYGVPTDPSGRPEKRVASSTRAALVGCLALLLGGLAAAGTKLYVEQTDGTRIKATAEQSVAGSLSTLGAEAIAALTAVPRDARSLADKLKTTQRIALSFERNPVGFDYRHPLLERALGAPDTASIAVSNRVAEVLSDLDRLQDINYVLLSSTIAVPLGPNGDIAANGVIIYSKNGFGRGDINARIVPTGDGRLAALCGDGEAPELASCEGGETDLVLMSYGPRSSAGMSISAGTVGYGVLNGDQVSTINYNGDPKRETALLNLSRKLAGATRAEVVQAVVLPAE